MSAIYLIYTVLNILVWLIIAEVVVANLIAFGVRISPYHPLVKLLRTIVDPMLNPIRRMLPPYKTGGWDFSPMIVIFIIYALQSFLFRH